MVLENKTNIGKISNLPDNISKIKIIFDGIPYTAKLQVGPTVSNPGPILLKQEITAEILLSIDKPSKETINKLNKIIILRIKMRERV